jgi:hypothetical protein
MKFLNFLYQFIILKIINFIYIIFNIINFIINFIIDLAKYLHNVLIIIPFNIFLTIFIFILNFIYNYIFILIINFINFIQINFLINFIKQNLLNKFLIIYKILFKGKFLINDYYYYKILFNQRKFGKLNKYKPTSFRQVGWQNQKQKKTGFHKKQYMYVKIRGIRPFNYDVRLKRHFFMTLIYRSNKYNFSKIRSNYFNVRNFGKYFIFHYKPKSLQIFKQKKYFFKNYYLYYNYTNKYKKSLSLILHKNGEFKKRKFLPKKLFNFYGRINYKSTYKLIKPLKTFYSIKTKKKKLIYFKLKDNYFLNLISTKIFKLNYIILPQYQLIFLDRLYNFIWRPFKTIIFYFYYKKNFFSLKINNFLNSNWKFSYIWYYFTIYFSNYIPLNIEKPSKKKSFTFLTSSKNKINQYIINNEESLFLPNFKSFQRRSYPSIISYYEYPKYIKYWLIDLTNLTNLKGNVKFKLGLTLFPDWVILKGFFIKNKKKIIKQFGPTYKINSSYLYLKYLNYFKYYYFDLFYIFNLNFYIFGILFYFIYIYNFIIISSLNLNLLLNINHYLFFLNSLYYWIILFFNFFLIYIYSFWFILFYQFYLNNNYLKKKNIFFNIFFFFKNSLYYINSLTYNINLFNKNNLTYLPFNILFKLEQIQYVVQYEQSFDNFNYLKYFNFYYNYFNLNKSISNEILANFMDLIYPWYLNSIGPIKFGFTYLNEKFTMYDDDDFIYLHLFADITQPYKKSIINLKLFYQDIDYFFNEDTWFRIFNEQKFIFSFDQLDYEERIRWDNIRYLRYKDNLILNNQNYKKLYSKELFKSLLIYPLDKGYYRTLNERIINLFFEPISTDYVKIKFNEINLWLNIISYFFILNKNNFVKFLIFKIELFLKPFGLIDYSIFKPIWSIYYRYHLKYLLIEYINKKLTINFWDKDIAIIGDNDYVGLRTLESNFHTNLDDEYELDSNEFVDDELLDNLIEDIDQFDGQIGIEFYQYKNFYYDVPNTIKQMSPYLIKLLYLKFLNKNESFYSNSQEKRIEDLFFERYTEYYLYNCIKPLPSWYYKILFLPDIFDQNSGDSTNIHLEWNYSFLLTFGQTNYYHFGIAYENLFFKQVGFNNWIPYLYFFFYFPFVLIPTIFEFLNKQKYYLFSLLISIILINFQFIFNIYIKKSTIYYVCFNLFQFNLFLFNKFILNLLIDSFWFYFLLNNNYKIKFFNNQNNKFNFIYDWVNLPKKINFFLQNLYLNLNLNINFVKKNLIKIYYLNYFIQIKYFFYNYIYYYYLKYLNFKYLNIFNYFLINFILIFNFLFLIIFFFKIINFSLNNFINLLIFNYVLNLYNYLFLPIYFCLIFLFYYKIFKFSKTLLESDFKIFDDIFFLVSIFIPFMFFFDFMLLKIYLFDKKRANEVIAPLYSRISKFPLHWRQGHHKSKKIHRITGSRYFKKSGFLNLSKWRTYQIKRKDIFLNDPIWIFDGGKDYTLGPKNEFIHEHNYKSLMKRKGYKLP